MPQELLIQAPIAKIEPKSVTLHGDTRVDNYFWLRNRNDPDTLRYIEAENAYTQAARKPWEPVEAKLYAEMLGRIKQTDLSVPVKRDHFLYYTRTEEGKQYPIYCRSAATPEGNGAATEKILLDGNVLAQGVAYFQMGVFAPSPNHKLLAYSVDLTGDEVFTIHIEDLETQRLLADQIPNTAYSLEWANDNLSFFYTVLDAAKRPYRVYRHTLGVAEDTLVYQEDDQRFEVDLAKTSSRAYLLIQVASPLTTETLCLDAGQPAGQFKTVLPRVPGVEYDLTHRGDSFFIRTNQGAKTFRVVEAPVSDPSEANWREVLPARAEVTVESINAFAGHLVFEERERGLNKIRIQNFDSHQTHFVEFPEPVYSVGLTGNAEFATPILRFTYTSLITPHSVIDYNMDTRERELKKRQPVLGGYDPSEYQSERIYATASDGVQVPISLVYKKGMVRDGLAPTLLYGYGAYGISADPNFSSDRLSLLDRGMVYAIAHVRGGGDLGKPWHEEGRLLKKKNTFTDFVACAEALIAGRYTSPARLAMEGRSAGGLLAGAVLNLRPDLFAVALAGVPFVDALNTMLDASLPLTVGEYEEWGNPAEQPYYDYIKSYSPYENVTAQRYPILLITAGLNDPRVPYWEAAKWAAKLRALRLDQRLLLLKTHMGSGHFGSSGRYEYLKETAFRYAFLLNALKVEDAGEVTAPKSEDIVNTL